MVDGYHHEQSNYRDEESIEWNSCRTYINTDGYYIQHFTEVLLYISLRIDFEL